MSKSYNYIFIGLAIVGGLFIVGYVVFFVMIFSAFGGFEKSYSVEDLKEEYFSREKEISELIQYFNKIKPSDRAVEIEFKDDENLARLFIIPKDTTKINYQEWDLNVKSLTAPSFKEYLEWDEDQIKVLKEKLDNANCISIEDGEPIKIGFKRSGLGMFSFNIFQNRETDRSKYDDGCHYRLVNNKLALEYGGGAVGPQCFPVKNN